MNERELAEKRISDARDAFAFALRVFEFLEKSGIFVPSAVSGPVNELMDNAEREYTKTIKSIQVIAPASMKKGEL